MTTNTEAMRAALQRIAEIQNQDYGGDWEEIEEARSIARAALAQPEPPRPTLAPGLANDDGSFTTAAELNAARCAETVKPLEIKGLGRITDDDAGHVRLELIDEDAAQQFMRDFAPSVDVDQMPPISPAEQPQPSAWVGMTDAQRIAELTLQVQQLTERFESANRMRNALLEEVAALRAKNARSVGADAAHVGWLAQNKAGHCRLMTDLEIAASNGEYTGVHKLYAAPNQEGEGMSTRTVMPIMGAALLAEIPWAMIAPHEDQAQRNHGQSLERLAQRGGLGASEAINILEGRRFGSAKPRIENEAYLINLVRKWRAEQKGGAA